MNLIELVLRIANMRYYIVHRHTIAPFSKASKIDKGKLSFRLQNQHFKKNIYYLYIYLLLYIQRRIYEAKKKCNRDTKQKN